MEIYTYLSHNARTAIRHALTKGEETYAHLIQEGANSAAIDEELHDEIKRGFQGTLDHIASWCDTPEETEIAQLGARLQLVNSTEAAVENWFKTHYNKEAHFDTAEQALDAYFSQVKNL